jgi:hypothetical protein
MSDVVLEPGERFVRTQQLYASMLPVTGDWKQQFSAIRHNYRLYAAAVERGEESWGYPCDPSMIAPWPALFTPIEAAVWSDIRYYGAPFWPQFPAGRFMLDFADPVRRIGLECDGAAFHDARKDHARDGELEELGWQIYRAPGRDCYEERVVFRDYLGIEFDLEHGLMRNLNAAWQG